MTTSTSDQYALNWGNHASHVKKAFDSLLAANEFVDVTLACEGKKISAHKMLLSACSVYFHDLFRDNPCQHPIVMLKDVKYQHLVDILKFIYNGEVSITTDNFDSFLRTAEFLQISGLTDSGHYATTDKDNSAISGETHITSEHVEFIETKPYKQVEQHTEKPVSRKTEKAKDVKRKTLEISPVTPKRRKENIVVNESVPLKKEKVEVFDEEQQEDPLEISNQNHDEMESYVDENNAELVQESEDPQRFYDVQDLLTVKSTKANKNKIHKLEERIGKLEASRSFCKGCFVRTRLGQLSKDKIKKVNTFCPGCDGFPNYCKGCFKRSHKDMKNVV